MSITDDGDICSSFKVDVEDFSGVADVIYKAMGKNFGRCFPTSWYDSWDGRCGPYFVA